MRQFLKQMKLIKSLTVYRKKDHHNLAKKIKTHIGITFFRLFLCTSLCFFLCFFSNWSSDSESRRVGEISFHLLSLRESDISTSSSGKYAFETVGNTVRC